MLFFVSYACLVSRQNSLNDKVETRQSTSDFYVQLSIYNMEILDWWSITGSRSWVYPIWYCNLIYLVPNECGKICSYEVYAEDGSIFFFWHCHMLLLKPNLSLSRLGYLKRHSLGWRGKGLQKLQRQTRKDHLRNGFVLSATWIHTVKSHLRSIALASSTSQM